MKLYPNCSMHYHGAVFQLSTRVTVPQPSPRSRVILQELAGFWQVKKFPTLYGTWRIMTTRAQYLYLVTCYVISTHRMQDDQSFYRSVPRSTQLSLFHVFFWSLPGMFWGQVRSLIQSSQNTACYFSNDVRTTKHKCFFKIKRTEHLSSLKGSFSYIY